MPTHVIARNAPDTDCVDLPLSARMAGLRICTGLWRDGPTTQRPSAGYRLLDDKVIRFGLHWLPLDQESHRGEAESSRKPRLARESRLV